MICKRFCICHPVLLVTVQHLILWNITNPAPVWAGGNNLLPEYYEDLGDGIYQVYVEVGGEIVPFVTVNSATGDYHG